MAQWIECQPANQKVAGSVPHWGTCLGCRFCATDQCFSPSLPLSKINIVQKREKCLRNWKEGLERGEGRTDSSREVSGRWHRNKKQTGKKKEGKERSTEEKTAKSRPRALRLDEVLEGLVRRWKDHEEESGRED